MKHNILLFLSLLLFSACASFTTGPQGGPQDAAPPVVLQIIPPKYTTNMTTDKIVLKFDEYVILKNTSNILISPPTKAEYTINLKELRIKLTDTLQANTTYSISFYEAIGDLNEGNPIPDLDMVFSTGSYIDSMYINGRIEDAFDYAPVPKMTVALYISPLDSFPFVRRPDYVGKTDESGYFIIPNIPDHCYQVLAFDDKNSNLQWEPLNEKVAFSPKCIRPKALSERYFLDTAFFADTAAQDSLRSVLEKQSDLYLYAYQDRIEKYFIDKATISRPGLIELSFRYPLEEDLKWEIIKDSVRLTDTLYATYSLDRKKMTLYTVDMTLNKGKLLTAYKQYADTSDLFLPFQKKKKIDTLPLVFTSNLGVRFSYWDTLKINASQPIKSFNSDSIFVWSYAGKDTMLMQAVFIKKNPMQYAIYLPMQENMRYQVLLLPGSFTDIYGTENDTIAFRWQCAGIEKYGSFRMKISDFDPSKAYVFECMNESNVVLEKYPLPLNGEINIRYMYPGKYKFRLIEDENRNGVWNGGEFETRKLPEKIYYFNKVVPIEKEWEIEEKWSLSQQ